MYMLCYTQVLIPDDDGGVTVLNGDTVGDSCGGNSSVSFTIILQFPGPLIVYARTPKI